MIWAVFTHLAFAGMIDGVVAIDHIQVIDLEESFEYSWGAEKPLINTVTVLVLEIPNTRTGLPQVGAPVLFVGATPAARVHPGGADEHIVVFVPGKPDIVQTPIFWGPELLPETVTHKMGQAIMTSQTRATFSPEAIHTASQPSLTVRNQGALYGHIATLIDEFAPADRAFSQSIRVTLGQ